MNLCSSAVRLYQIAGAFALPRLRKLSHAALYSQVPPQAQHILAHCLRHRCLLSASQVLALSKALEAEQHRMDAGGSSYPNKGGISSLGAGSSGVRFVREIWNDSK